MNARERAIPVGFHFWKTVVIMTDRERDDLIDAIEQALLAHEKQIREEMVQEADKWISHWEECALVLTNKKCNCGLTEWLAKMKGKK